jgi:uncharacterized protein YcbX
MHLSGLFIYPVKSLRGISVSTAELDALGPVGDRRFMIVDVTGRFLTQRTLPRMALIQTELNRATLTLSASGAGTVCIPRESDSAAPLRTVSVWRSEGLQAEDCGDAAAVWLENILGVPCRLVRAGARFHRPIEQPGKTLAGEAIGFVDAYPLLVIGEASLSNLNDRLIAEGEEPVPMDRFRPNLVIAGGAAFAEDSWPGIRVGGVVLRAGGPCARCVITTTDQATAERGKEPLRTLATYRRDASDPANVNFGQNFRHESKSGMLHVGAPVEVLP